jgi:hypothetical protein
LVHDDEAERDYSDQQSANDHAKKRVAPASAIVSLHLNPSPINGAPVWTVPQRT